MYNFSTTTLELVFLTIIVEDARAALGLRMILSDLAIVIQGGGVLTTTSPMNLYTQNYSKSHRF